MKLYFAGLTKEPSFGILERNERQHDGEQRSPIVFSSPCSFRGWGAAGSSSGIVLLEGSGGKGRTIRHLKRIQKFQVYL